MIEPIFGFIVYGVHKDGLQDPMGMFLPGRSRSWAASPQFAYCRKSCRTRILKRIWTSFFKRLALATG